MNLKKIGIAAMAMLALGAVLATSAFAGTPETKKASWTYKEGGVNTLVPANEAIKCKKGAAAGNFVFKTVVAGFPTELQATGIECPEAKLVNKAVGGVNMATAEGKIKFTGVTVLAPAGCTTPATNTTNALVADLVMDKTVGTKSFAKFEPAAGPEGTFTFVELGVCAAKGKYPAKGVVYAEATKATGVYEVTQEAIGNVTTHAMSTLKLGPEPATLTGEIAVELNGANQGKAWGAEEK